MVVVVVLVGGGALAAASNHLYNGDDFNGTELFSFSLLFFEFFSFENNKNVNQKKKKGRWSVYDQFVMFFCMTELFFYKT